ncbi:tail fiber protein [Neisseriaceae bacterium JH1-16]|nr:tail fiber protein [Neisseriaceae bacterium JH1-16]
MQTINTQDGLFHDGNPATGELGTIVPASWLNSIQTELLSVLAAGKLTADPANNSQLLNAIKQLAWNSTSDRPNTLAGYGITDALALKPTLGSNVDLNSLTSPGLYAQSSSANATLALNYPVAMSGQLMVYASGVGQTTGVIQLYHAVNTPRSFWRSLLNGSWSAWSEAASTVSAVPAGAIAHFAMATPPTGWLKANGAAVNRTAYAALFSAIGTTYGAGDGSTTFNLPDLRGEFVRGWDDGRGVNTYPSARVFGSWEDASSIATYAHADAAPAGALGAITNITLNPDGSGANLGISNANYNMQAASVINGGSIYAGTSKIRPRNLALLACIKY